MQNNFTNKKINAFLHQLAFKNILIGVFLFSLTTYAQSPSAPQVMEVEAYISSLKTIEKNYPSSFSNAQNVDNLVHSAPDAVYYYAGTVKTFGKKPSCLFTDFNSLQSIDNPTILKNNIEIVKLKINNSNDLNSKIDLSLLSNYKNLKYIYIVSNQTVNAQSIANMIRNYDEKYSVFYKIDKGE